MLIQLPHYTQFNPYETNFFPYTYGQFTSIRYWVESRPPMGDRLVHQSLNPFEKTWNNIKYGEYGDLLFLTLNATTYIMEEQAVNFCDLDDSQLRTIIEQYYLTADQITVVIRYLNSGRINFPQQSVAWRDPSLIPSMQTQNRVPKLILTRNAFPKSIPIGVPEIKKRSRKGKDEQPMTPEQRAVYEALLKKM